MTIASGLRLRAPTWAALLLASSTALTGGCTAETDELSDLDLDTTAAELNGTWTTTNCTTTQRNKLKLAFDLIQTRLGSSEYLECVKSAFLTYQPEDVLVEDLIDDLQARSTTAKCVAPGACGGSAAACAGVGGPENFSIETDYLMSATPESIAGTIVHEVAHTIGYNHPGSPANRGYPWSVPGQVGTCMNDLLADGWTRDQTFGDTELSPVGGGGGQPFLLRCKPGERVVGLTADTNNHINRLRLRCSDGSYTARVGSYMDSVYTRNANCAAGSSMVAFWSWSDSMVRALWSYCAPDAELLADDPTPTLSGRAVGGAGIGTVAYRKCPVGMAIIGAVGRSGARIDQLRWLCGDVDGVVIPNHHTSVLKGSKSGNGKIGLCYGNGALWTLYGHAGGEVDQLGGECLPTMVGDDGLPSILPFPQNTLRHGIDYNGGWGGPVFDSKDCPTDKLLVGLRVRSGARIDAVGGICADPESWAAGYSSTVSYTPLSGGSSGVYSNVYCPSREFVGGLSTWGDWTPEHSTTTVHGLELQCRDLARAPGCADSVTVTDVYGGPANMSGCAGSVTWSNRESLCAPGYSACTASEWIANRNGRSPRHNYWTADNLRYGGSASACWADTDSGNACNQPMRVCVPGGDDDWNGDGVQDNDCNWSRCGWEGSSTPNQDFGGCSNDTTAGTLCCLD